MYFVIRGLGRAHM